MKRLAAFILFIALLGNVKAQEWFPVGAKWTYTAFYLTYPNTFGIGYMECTKDTVIDEITAKVLKGSSKCAMSYNENIFYYNDTADILYYYVDSAFRPYFDFSKKAGESYYLYFPSYSYGSGLRYDSLLITVDSVVVKPFAGINVRYQYISGIGVDPYGLLSPIVEYVGAIGSLYLVDRNCDHGHFSELRCYHDNIFSYYGKPIYEELGCDVNLSINEALSGELFRIFPNPTTGQLTIDCRDAMHCVSTVEIYSVVGQKVGTYQFPSFGGAGVVIDAQTTPSCGHPSEGGEYSPFEGGRGMSEKAPSLLERAGGEVVIDVSGLANGLYFLKIDNKVVKFVKE